jgi:hypothetical protein
LVGGVTKFNVKFQDAMYRLVLGLAGRLETSMADVIREALSLYGWAAHEHEQGNKLLIQRGDEVSEVVIPSLQRLRPEIAPRQEVVGTSEGLSRRRRPATGDHTPTASAEDAG